jgi:integrase
MSELEANPIISNWLGMLKSSHTNNENTATGYIRHFKQFLELARKTPEEIIDDYEKMDEKHFKRLYTPIVMSFVLKITKEGYSPATQQNALSAVKSFFKYNSLPLNFLPTGRRTVMFHNRDITKEEIEEIIKVSQPREKAYYSLMVQSGLRPNEISKLKIDDLEKLLDQDTTIPCLIKIRQEATKGQYKPYFTFAGQESINYIKEYFKRENRSQLTSDDWLFTKDDGKTETDSDLISHIFRRTVEKLKKQGVLDFKNKKGEKANRNELRLYNLRKYFRNHAGKAGADYANFWMGHSLGVDGHYFSQTDVETHRKQYREKAMPELRIETKTPDQNEDTITKLEQENKVLRNRLEKIEKKLFSNQPDAEYEKYLSYNEDEYDRIEKQHEEQLKWDKEHPEEVKKQTEQMERNAEEYDKWLQQNPEVMEQGEKAYVAHLEDRITDLEKMVQDLTDLFKKDKESKK